MMSLKRCHSEVSEFERFRTEVMNFYYQNPIRNPYSLTLTMKQKVGEERLDNIKSSTNLRHFRNRINKKIFGNSYYRYKNQIQMFSVLENDTDHRFHLHLIIEKPTQLTDGEFRNLVYDCWLKTKFGYHQIQLDRLPLDDEKYWLRYLTKKRTKDGNLWSSIDWENCSNFQTSLS